MKSKRKNQYKEQAENRMIVAMTSIVMDPFDLGHPSMVGVGSTILLREQREKIVTVICDFALRRAFSLNVSTRVKL